MNQEQRTSTEQSGPSTSAGAWGLRHPGLGSAIVAAIASLVFATAALAQMPTSPWKKAAPFPEPDEELYGVAVNGKLYVIGGWGGARLGASPTSMTRPPTNGRRKGRCRGRRTMRPWPLPTARCT
jgi:hypothetical protein